MRQFIACAAFVVALVLAATASAAPPVPYPGNSEPGVERYEGLYGTAAANAQCGTSAGSGSFGYFGKGLNLAGGADGYQTGLNNSAVCGNRP